MPEDVVMSAANEAIRRAKGPGPWTPGPWELKHTNPEATGSDWPVQWHVIPRSGWNESFFTFNEANARLIALAPEMAEFIARFASSEGLMDTPNVLDRWLELRETARALLARARGEA